MQVIAIGRPTRPGGEAVLDAVVYVGPVHPTPHRRDGDVEVGGVRGDQIAEAVDGVYITVGTPEGAVRGAPTARPRTA
jgi:hypothetical protein